MPTATRKWPIAGNGTTWSSLVDLPPPVVFHVTDGKANFLKMDIAALKAIIQDIIQQGSPPKHSKSPRGGDLFVYPVDTVQQEAL